MSTDFDLAVKFGDAEFKANGSSELVMQAFNDFKSLLDDPVVGAHASQAPAAASPSANSKSKPPFAVFMKREWPNQAAKATAIFTWAKRYDGRDRLKPGEMAGYWKRFDKKPGNPTMACQGAEKKGWLEQLGNGFYAVTGHGENMVENTSPL